MLQNTYASVEINKYACSSKYFASIYTYITARFIVIDQFGSVSFNSNKSQSVGFQYFTRSSNFDCVDNEVNIGGSTCCGILGRVNRNDRQHHERNQLVHHVYEQRRHW